MMLCDASILRLLIQLRVVGGWSRSILLLEAGYTVDRSLIRCNTQRQSHLSSHSHLLSV